MFFVLMLAAALGGCAHPADYGTPAQPTVNSSFQADPHADQAPPVTWDEQLHAFTQSGHTLKAAKLWRFTGSTDGFITPGALASVAPGGGLTIANKVYGAFVRTPDNLGLVGARDPTILVRITRIAAGAQWDPIVYYTTNKHAETEYFKAKVYRGHDPAVGETTTLVYDMAHLATGGRDWTQSVIRQVRFQTDDQPGGSFTLREIAVTEPLPH